LDTKRFPLHILAVAAAGLILLILLGVNLLLANDYPSLLLLAGIVVCAGVIAYGRTQILRQSRRALNELATTSTTRLHRMEQTRIDQLVTLNRILTLLSDTLSPETVLDTVVSSASTLSGAASVAVYLFREDGLALARSTGLSGDFRAEPPRNLLVTEAPPLDFQQPVVVNDAAGEARAEAMRPMIEREGIAAWIELPLLYQGVRVGVIALYFKAPRSFSLETVELLRTFASQCAQAISNARLYAITDEALERRVGQLLALANIGHHLTATLEVHAICALVTEYVRESTGATATAILLLNRRGLIEEWAVSGQAALHDPSLLTEAGVAARAIETKDAVVVNDAQARPTGSSSPALSSTLLNSPRAQLGAPILWNERVVGVITLESTKANAFSEEDSYFVKQLANQAIIAIENARLFRKVSEARDRMQVILNTVKEALILVSTSGEIVLVNPRVELLGLQPENLLGQSVDNLLLTGNLGLAERLGFRMGSEVQRLVKELRAPGGLVAREPKTFTVEDSDSVRYVERQVFPVHDEAEQPVGVLLVFYDVTEQMKLAKTREEVSQMLIHDLRSPLTAVTTSLKLLIDLTPKDSEFRPLIETTTDSSRRAIRTLLNRVDSLLDVARMESGFMTLDTRASELATLVDNVCIELSPLAQELGVMLKPDISGALPLLAIDTDKVERVLLNLVDNALKFSPAASTVKVAAHPPGAGGAEPNFVRIDVIDNGPGVPDEYKLLLFDRFVQIRERKGARRGTGLGLTFCRLVTENHGGRIWIEDNPGGGSIFAFTLPVATESESVRSE
jgi:PAS domain S-box-containing protein